MLATSKLRGVLALCLVAGLCLAVLGCGPKETEPVVVQSESELTMDPAGLGRLDARLYYIQSKYGLSSEETQAKMGALYEETGLTDVAWDNYRKWLNRQVEDIVQAYEQSKKAELARLRREGLE